MTTQDSSSTTGPAASGPLASPGTPVQAAPHVVRPDRLASAHSNPEVLRADLSRLRAEVGETIEALVERLDVPSRVQGKAREVTERAKHTAGQVVDQAQQKAQQAQQKAQEASQLVAQKVPDVVKQRSGRTAALAGGAVLVGLLVIGILVRRSG